MPPPPPLSQDPAPLPPFPATALAKPPTTVVEPETGLLTTMLLPLLMLTETLPGEPP
jgi:hypothetical protein